MADVLAVRNEFRLQNWMEIIRECEESGLSNREFCSQRGISEKTSYYWLRKLDAQAFRWLMEGLQIEQPKAIRKVKKKSMF